LNALIQFKAFSKDTCASLGRNGWIQTVGLEMYSSGGREAAVRGAATVRLYPVISKQKPGRCVIEIPLDDLPEVIKNLQQCVALLGRKPALSAAKSPATRADCAACKVKQSLQWLVDDMTDAGEDRNPETGEVYDSVAAARKALKKCGKEST
jgi:hypothetical protein